MIKSDLITSSEYVEVPFIAVKIGEYAFGSIHSSSDGLINRVGTTVKKMYPNFMKSIRIVKINGTVNTYSINLIYAIQPGDDPNKIDYILSTISSDRKIYISYGDCSKPSYIFREEEAIITSVSSNVNVAGSNISYTIEAISTSLPLMANFNDFAATEAKPSDELKSMIRNQKYGIADVFKGMRDFSKLVASGIIASNDKKVRLEAQTGVSTWDRIKYLVGCMVNVADSANTIIKNSAYLLTIDDSINNLLGGTCFKVKEVPVAMSTASSEEVFEVDIGYPGKTFVTGFNVLTNDAWSLLYKASNAGEAPKYVYKINNEGKMVQVDSPSLVQSNVYNRVTTYDSNWWSDVTQFPINASLTIRGLLKPSILLQYVKLNVLFFGQKHISSGYYIITKQEDIIDASGYRTNLSLTRLNDPSESAINSIHGGGGGNF